MTGYDVIGDVHGHADKLTALLRALGYTEHAGAWRHSRRQAVFVGDIIDRGSQQLETIGIVRRMVDAGTARIVLGNHEFNAVAYATRADDGNGTDDRHLRIRSRKNRSQHAAFIAEVGLDSALHRELIDWFTTIPLWLELDGLRVIHACWSAVDVAYLQTRVSEAGSLTERLVVDASNDGHDAYNTIERVLKGPEVRLPYGMKFHDKGRHERANVRLKWWDPTATNWSDLLPPGTPINDADRQSVESLPDEPIPTERMWTYTGDVPVIFGHYWFRPPLVVVNPLALCVDYSAGAAGPLAAYRFDGEPSLTSDHLVHT